MKVRIFKCRLCKAEWISRLDKRLPKQCPRCKRLDWNKKKNAKSK